MSAGVSADCRWRITRWVSKAESDTALGELIEKYEKTMACGIACVLAFRGEADRAFEWLDKAVQYDDPISASLPATRC